jgi:pyruvate dehydrogenase E2 component (dihydrolipoamide acetyltransferase)
VLIEVIMPKAGMDMQEGQIVKWKKNEGEYVKKGEILLEITTDKVNMEVEAEASGYLLKKLKHDGDIVPVITTIGYLGDIDDEIPELENMPVKESEKVEVAKIDSKKEENYIKVDKIRATPAARKIARDRNIDLKKVIGTGPKNRIQKIDVENYIESEIKITPLAKRIAEDKGIDLSTVVGSGHGGKIFKEDLPLESLKSIPMSNMRKIIAKRMSESYFTAPTFTLNLDVDMTKSLSFRDEIFDYIMKETNKKVTITDIISFATTRALMKHPHVNARLDEDNIIIHDYVNLAIAIGLEEGLLTPVIKDAHLMTFKEMVLALKDIQERAKSMRLSPDDLQGSTFTISNLGMYGITQFNPIINLPNSAILGVSAIQERAIPANGEIKIRPIMTLSLTLDHRIIDGVIGAKFLQELKNYLENPITMLIG